ncbi:Methylthioribose-1-phosphate isomerase-like protein [Drosera capensis]
MTCDSLFTAAGYGLLLSYPSSFNAENFVLLMFHRSRGTREKGSGLTALELVHDNIPATLIANSAAAALMKAGRVHVVIVGNGIILSEEAHYPLAFCARHHGIPFFVVAPLTSIDLSMSLGEEIGIEERPQRELLFSCCGLGEQVAADGI